MEKTVIIIRGISGSGKSTFAKLISEPKVVCTADDFFEKDGQYNFDPTKLGVAHGQCMLKFERALNNPEVENIVVANTNTKPSDYKFYVERASEFEIPVFFVVLEKRHSTENVHGVGEETLKRQLDNLNKDIKLI